jgi:SPOR domain
MVGGIVPEPMSSTEASRVRRPGLEGKSPPAEPSGRRLGLWSVLPVCAGFAVFGVVVWLAYQDASLGPPGGEPPLIRAAPQAIKLPPDQADEETLAAEEGEIGRLWSDAQPDQPERLLPLPEQPLLPPAGEAAGGADGGTGDAAPPSDAPGQRASHTAPAQPPTDQSLQEAEAALDRLLAEVTAVSEGAGAPGASAARPADTNGTGAAAAPPAREQGADAAPPGPAANPPATTTAAAAPPIPAAPPAPPQKPAAPATTTAPAGRTSVRVAVSGAASPDPRPRAAATETAALSVTQAPPIASDGDFRIQLAAVRGQADARRAWELFARDLGPALRGIEPIFERADTVNGVFYRVQIGPFARQEAAESLCEQLKQHNASCFVIRR